MWLSSKNLILHSLHHPYVIFLQNFQHIQFKDKITKIKRQNGKRKKIGMHLPLPLFSPSANHRTFTPVLFPPLPPVQTGPSLYIHYCEDHVLCCTLGDTSARCPLHQPLYIPFTFKMLSCHIVLNSYYRWIFYLYIREEGAI